MYDNEPTEEFIDKTNPADEEEELVKTDLRMRKPRKET